MAINQTGSASTGRQSASLDMGARQRTPDVTHDLVSVVYHALQGCQTYEQYAQDAEQDGKQDVADFFRGVMQEDQRRAERGQQLIAQCLQQQAGSTRPGQMHSQGSASTAQQGDRAR